MGLEAFCFWVVCPSVCAHMYACIPRWRHCRLACRQLLVECFCRFPCQPLNCIIAVLTFSADKLLIWHPFCKTYLLFPVFAFWRCGYTVSNSNAWKLGQLDRNTHRQPFYGLWSGTTLVGRYQKKHSRSHTHPDHQTSFVNFLHLLRSIASSCSVYMLDSPFRQPLSGSSLVFLFTLHTFLHPVIMDFTLTTSGKCQQEFSAPPDLGLSGVLITYWQW